MLDANAESFTELRQHFRQFEGGRTLVRSRLFFVAHIDRFDFTDEGFAYSGQLQRPIEGAIKCGFDYGAFEWSYSWEWLTGGHGVVHAPYVSWSLYYDQPLVSSVLAVLDADPTADAQAMRLIAAWERTRAEARST